MSQSCRFEADVVRAASEDRWSDSLRQHLLSCRDCTGAAAVAPWMDRFARISDREHILPDPSLVWLKAQLLQGKSDVARVTRPLNIAQVAAYVIVAAGWAALLMSKWSSIESLIRGFTPVGLVETAARAESLSISLLATVIALASITIMLALHTILAEE